MSKEATGENGAVLGSSDYWNRVNRATFFGTLMQRPSETNYHETLREVGNRAGAAVEEIYDDLQEHINVIRNISSDRRSALAKQVQSLYDVCRMSGSFCSHSSDCIGILNLSSFYLPGSSLRDDRAVQTAIQKIKNCSDFFASECLDLLQKAVDWSISFAAGSDARKTAFLQDISQGKDKEFLRDVLNTYRSNNESVDLRGRCGYSIGSREYLNYVERKVLLQDLPAIYSDDYDGGIKGSLEDIARQLQRDLSQNERENNYITDDTARNLRAAVSELEHCGIITGISDSMIERLAWLVGGQQDTLRIISCFACCSVVNGKNGTGRRQQKQLQILCSNCYMALFQPLHGSIRSKALLQELHRQKFQDWVYPHSGIFLKEVQIRIRGSLFSEQINRMVVSIILISIRLRDEASKAESTIHLNFSVQI